MLNPVEAMECPMPPQFDRVFAQAIFRLRMRVVALDYPHTPKEVFYCFLRALGSDAPVLEMATMRHGGAFWYRAPNGTAHLVLSAGGTMRYQQGILLIIHHLMEVAQPSHTCLCMLFDDACWQTSREYATHRAVFAYLMTTRLSPTFRATY